jgi:hypothetical protein
MSAVPRTISLPEDVLAKALDRQKAYDYKKFSDYIHALIIADLNSGEVDHVRKHHSKEGYSNSLPAYALNERHEKKAQKK